MSRIVGHVRALNRFPVKSMAGERLDVAELDWQGIEGDRQYAFVRAANGTRFPWLTACEVPAMVLHRARFDDPARPKTSAVTVETPEGATVPLRDPLLMAQLEAAAGEPATLIQVARGIYDSMPVSIQTSAGHAALEAAHGEPLAIDRFRINLIVESDAPATEWRGRRLAFGREEDGAMVQCADPIARCVIVTIDPETGVKEPRVLRTVARNFGNAYGVYAGPARPGLIRLGDTVRLLD